MKKLICSANGLRLRFVERGIQQSCQGSELLLLAPTRGAADDFARRLCAGAAGLLGLHRMTPAQLAAALATEDLAERGLAPLSRLGVQALASRCIHRCLQEKVLEYFRPVAGMPGFARALAATLSELRLEQIDPGELASSGEPGRDLSRLLGQFEAELEAGGFADLARTYQLATESTRKSTSRFIGLPLFLLDVRIRSSLEKQFIRALVNRASVVLATAIPGDEEGKRALEDVLAVEAEDLDNQGTVVFKGSLDRARHCLFRVEEPPVKELDDSLEFFSAAGEGAECVEIARRILQAANDGVAFDQVGILLRNPLIYQPQLEDAFRRAGIPGYFSRGTVRPDPAGRAFLALLASAAEGLSASRFAEYLSLGQVPYVADTGGPPKKVAPWVTPGDEAQMVFKTAEVETEETPPAPPETDESPVIAGTLRAPVHWERLLVDAAVIGGKDRWMRRLDGLDQELRLKLQEVEDEMTQKQHLESQLERLAHLRNFAIPVVGFLDDLPRQASWGEWLDLLRKLAGMVLRKPESVLAVLAELEPMREVGPVGLGEVQEILADRLRFLRTEPPERRYGRVFVGTLEEAAACSFEIVFLPGLAEGIFPKKTLEDPLLLDEYRQKLSSALPLRQDKSEEERLLLRMGCAAAQRKLVVSYPRMDVAQGRARVPSLYALELLRAAEGRLPDLGQLERRAAEAAQSRLGWPSPRIPEKAIDDTEYDLAVLDGLLHNPHQTVKGKGRFLLEVNPYLARSLRARHKRWRPQWSDADGIVAADARTRETLERHRLSSRPYSVTALQSYAACPYRFLLYGIHHLRPREEAVAIQQLDPLTRGRLFHAAQFELFRRLSQAGLLPTRSEYLDRILSLVDETLDRVAAECAERLAPAIPRIWESEIEDLRVDLRCWMREVVNQEQSWKPIHYEFSFGLPLQRDRDSSSRAEDAVIMDGVRLRGSIDLIEYDESRKVLRVTDHKTGKLPQARLQFIGNGEILQPLLYGWAAEDLLGIPVESGRLYYCTQRGEFQQQSVLLNDLSRRVIQQVTGTIDQAIARGFLPAAPRRDACQNCDYHLVCGPYEEIRTRSKPGKELEPLEEIRRIS